MPTKLDLLSLGALDRVTLVTKVRCVKQKANVTFADRGPLAPDIVQAIHDAVPALPDTILFPWHWPGAMR